MIIIDFVFFLLLSFVTYNIVYRLVRKTEQESEFATKLKAKVLSMSHQQDELLEEAANRGATFVTAELNLNDNDSPLHNITNSIHNIMQRGGLTDMPMHVFVMICCSGGALLSAIIVYFNFLNMLTGVPIGMAIGAYLAYSILVMRVSSRRMLFLQQFPDAIDMMIRGIKAGLNINRIMKLVSMESKDPIAGEFRTISQKLELGMEAEKVFVEAANKIGVEEFRFLVVALVLQMENGGMLGEILQNLSTMVRKRLELGLKIKAMSAEARMSAIVISALPFVFAGIMALINPSHIKEFTGSSTGRMLLRVLVTLFALGVFFMLRATKIKV